MEASNMFRYILMAVVLAVSFWSARACDIDRAAGGSDQLSFIDAGEQGSIFYIPASGCSGALQSVTLTLIDGSGDSFKRGEPRNVDVVAHAVDQDGNIVNSTVVTIHSTASGEFTWTWDPPVQMAPVTHTVHPTFYFRGEAMSSIPTLMDEYVIAFEGLGNFDDDFLHIELDRFTQATEDDVFVVYVFTSQLESALLDSVAAVDRRDHMTDMEQFASGINPAIKMTFIPAEDVSAISIRHVQQGDQFTELGVPLVNGRGDVVFEVEYDGVTEVNATDAECRNCNVKSVIAIGEEKRAVGSLFHVTVTPTCEGLVTLCLDDLCSSVNNISCVLSVLGSL